MPMGKCDDLVSDLDSITSFVSYSFEKPSAIQQRAIMPCIQGIYIYIIYTKLGEGDLWEGLFVLQ